MKAKGGKSVFGLTGGIGSGKSSAADLFRRLNIRVTDADQVAREVVKPGTEALESIAQHFGPDILLADGSLDRPQLRQRIFQNPAEKSWLEKLLHPLIRQEIMQHLDQPYCHSYQLLESPLLMETDQKNLVQAIIVVDVDEATQIARASARDSNTIAQIKAIIHSQLPREQRLAQADYVLDNSGSLADLERQVLALHQKLLQCSRTTGL